jgi:hypothetical protein
MRMMHGMGRILAGLLVGLGVAVLLRTIVDVGGDHFALGYVVGPGLMAAGIARLRLQRLLDERGDDSGTEGSDGDPS